MSKQNSAEHIEFPPHTAEPRCVKCKNETEFKIKFQKYYTDKSNNVRIERNNLLVECQECRFCWVMDCADSTDKADKN